MFVLAFCITFLTLLLAPCKTFFANLGKNSNAGEQIRLNSNLKVFEGSW